MSLKEVNYLSFTIIVAALLLIAHSQIHADSWYCDVVYLNDILNTNGAIDYTTCRPPTAFEYIKSPLSDDHYLHPYQGYFQETFILTIPHGNVLGLDGWVMINDAVIYELIWQNVLLPKNVLICAQESPPVIVHGRVAVIAQTGYNYYYHWIVEVLGRLALLEIEGKDFDYVYVPTHAAYMKETLELWGIPPSKIIEARDDTMVIADELIVPSLVSSVAVAGCPRLVHYVPTYIVAYVRTKLLKAIEAKNYRYQGNKKIFISRQDASSRKILNEDEIFELLRDQGFERYFLTLMSIPEQILLFKNAETIVSAIGSGLTNIIFCDPTTRIIELYQARRDCTIWNLSQMVGLEKNHLCVKTTEFIDQNEGQYDTLVPREIINELIAKLRI